MNLPALATQALATATAAAPAGIRSFQAAGPAFARTCELVAVYASLVNVSAQGPAGVDQPVWLGGCAGMLVPQVTVVYAKDCYPLPDDSHKPPKLPAAADLTAWTATYLGVCQAILDALVTAHEADLFGDCSSTTLGPVLFTGPSSGVATMQVPITVKS